MSVTRTSKFLSLVLRHEPARIGITLDRSGWTDVTALLDACAKHGVTIARDELAEIVRTSDKQRFALSEDGTRIRANQGHSVDVELELAPATPPDVLYHGTVERFLAGIRGHGLVKGVRHHVHLSADADIAKQVGARRGKPVVLRIRAAEMVAAGHAFFVSDNGVWLVEHVPADFIEFPTQHAAGGGSRGDKVKIARTTLDACDAGGYDVAGKRVDLAPAIAAAKAGTVMYETAPVGTVRHPAMPLEVTSETTIAAMKRLAREPGHLACLNFASAKNPGGGFLGGAQAQEESLARSSALYPCQLEHPEHYQRNRAHRSLLYLDLALWSPRVPFFRDDDGRWLDEPVLASVITCAAPNAGALNRGTSVGELEATLVRRARLVFAIAHHHAVDTLVLGAWGAGVFRNDPVMVARIFRDYLTGEFAGAFARVVFAVTGSSETSANHRAFAEMFGNKSHP